MPHLTCSATTLNQLYALVEAPDDAKLDDLNNDDAGIVYQPGLDIAN